MPTPTDNPNDIHRTHAASMTGAGETTRSLGSWEDEERWWRDNYAKRPYVSRDRNFDYYRPGYQYGFESAQKHGTRSWNEVETDLRTGWDKYEYRGKSNWEEIKESVRDAWEHLSGAEHERHGDRATRR
jgi:hypothetical protein